MFTIDYQSLHCEVGQTRVLRGQTSFLMVHFTLPTLEEYLTF